jgi:hypothetical protein
MCLSLVMFILSSLVVCFKNLMLYLKSKQNYGLLYVKKNMGFVN